jgi:glycosyltransferase involved in cell wall biosynthesis
MYKRLNVLIIAHEFSPEQGSECAEGWNLVTRLASFHNVTVIYAAGSQAVHFAYKRAVQRYFDNNGSISALTCIDIEQPKITRIIAKYNVLLFKSIGSIGLPLLYFIGYKFWQKSVYFRVKKITLTHKFDIIHQLTQITFREPGYLWKLPIPFVWGPTGGTNVISKGFFYSLSFKSKFLEIIRSASNMYQFHFVSRIVKANKTSKLIYTFSHDDKVIFTKRASGKVKLMLDAGTNNFLNSADHSIKMESDRITIIWCGQLIERKAPFVFLNAIALGNYDSNKVCFKVIGDGPLKTALMSFANQHGLNNIDWISNVSHSDVLKFMQQGDFFVHTSIREATSNVIPEALSMGLPVICHDIDGMSIAINNSCGLKIPMKSFEYSVKEFQFAISKFVNNKSYLFELKLGALNRAQEITWDKMAAEIAADYLEIHNENESFTY